MRYTILGFELAAPDGLLVGLLNRAVFYRFTELVKSKLEVIEIHRLRRSKRVLMSVVVRLQLLVSNLRVRRDALARDGEIPQVALLGYDTSIRLKLSWRHELTAGDATAQLPQQHIVV